MSPSWVVRNLPLFVQIFVVKRLDSNQFHEDLRCKCPSKSCVNDGSLASQSGQMLSCCIITPKRCKRDIWQLLAPQDMQHSLRICGLHTGSLEIHHTFIQVMNVSCKATLKPNLNCPSLLLFANTHDLSSSRTLEMRHTVLYNSQTLV